MLSLHSLFVLALLAGALAAPAQAQETDPILGEISRMADDQRALFADEALEQMRVVEKEISKLLVVKEKEPEKSVVDCISNKLNQIRALIKVSENIRAGLDDAIRVGAREMAAIELRKIWIARKQVDELRTAALMCGSTESGEGTTNVTASGEFLEDEGEGDVGFDGGDYESIEPPVSPYE